VRGLRRAAQRAPFLGHRACPHCQHHDSQVWLQRQLQSLVPATYFLVTFTLPAELRGLAWSHQRVVYALMMQCAWDTLATFSRNDPKLRATPGAVGVLHTHNRRLDFQVLPDYLWAIWCHPGRLTRVAHRVGRSVRRKRRPPAAVDNSALCTAGRFGSPRTRDSVLASGRRVHRARLAHEAIELATGAVQRVLFCFAHTRPYRRPAIPTDELPDGLPDVLPGKFIVVITAADDLAAEQPEVVAVSAHGGPGQTMVQQVQQEGRERSDELFADGDVRRFDMP